jgi:hypothetical protein
MDRPDGSADFVMRWWLIKSAFSRNIAASEFGKPS